MMNILVAKELEDYVIKGIGQGSSREKQARALLTSALSVENQMKVLSCNTSNEIWLRLESTFENKSSFERENLLSKFHSFRIKRASELSQGISQIENLAERLKLLGESISDENIMSVILRAVPASFKTFVTIWKGTAREERTLNNLITRLMAEIEDDKEPYELALVATRRFNAPRRGRRFNNFNSDSRQNNDQRMICYHCKLPGHSKRDCWKLKRETQSNTYHSPRGRNIHANYQNHEHQAQAMMAKREGIISTWIADSGSTFHICPNREWFSEYKEFSKQLSIGLGNQGYMNAFGSGKIITNYGTLTNVHWVPEASSNLFSEGAAAKLGLYNRGDGNKKVFTRDNMVIFIPGLCNGLYLINFEIFIRGNHAMKARSLSEWHRRLAHVSYDTIEKMNKIQAVTGLIINDSTKPQCLDCIENKCHKVSHPTRSSARAKKPGQVLHFDTVGPISHESINNAQYFVLCKDEYSGYRMIRFIELKRDIPDEVKYCINKSCLETGNNPLKIATDNGTEYLNKSLASFIKERGIQHELSVPYTPQQNGFIERDIRTIFEAGKTMLSKSRLSKKLWDEAMGAAVYTMNRIIPSNRNNTPYELWFGEKPDVGNLRRFGQKAVVLLPKHTRGKLDPNGLTVQFVGYTDVFNTYRVYDSDSDIVTSRCDLTFVEQDDIDTNDIVVENQSNLDDDELNIKGQEDPTSSTLELPKTSTKPKIGKDILTKDGEDVFVTPEGKAKESETTVETPPLIDVHNSPAIRESLIPKDLRIFNKAPPTISTRLRPLPPLPKDAYLPSNPRAKLATIEADDDPVSFTEAMSRPDKDKWLDAMGDEINSLKENKVWEIVDRPNTNVVTNRWVLRIKRKPTGEVDRYRARLVARGFSQIYGLDYTETYAPVVNMTSIRALLAYAASENLTISLFDVKTAFLYGSLDETIYMEQPEGFSVDNNKVCLLKKSLYGLKQAPRQWNIEFTNFVAEMNLKCCEADNCIFYNEDKSLFMAIYVDDGMVLAKDPTDTENLLCKLKQKFEINEVSPDTYLGFQIMRNPDESLLIHQESYIDKIIRKFNMKSSNSTDCPVTMTSQNNQLSQPLDDNIPYRQAIGSLMYAAVTTRLDIAFAVNRMSRKVSNPTETDGISVKRIFRYLKDKRGIGINYQTEQKGLFAYCDADFAGDEETARSTTGIVILFGEAPIYWRSQRQTLVTLSSTEAE